jgi:hypothetical protein
MYGAKKGMSEDIIEKATERTQSNNNLCALCVLCGEIPMPPKQITGH